MAKTKTNTNETAAERFEKDMINGVNYSSTVADLTDKLAKASAANARLVYQLHERDAKEAARARKQRKFRFVLSHVALLVGAVAALLCATDVIPFSAAVAVVCHCLNVTLCCFAFEILANKK